MAQLSKIGKYATSIRFEKGFTIVRYRNTDVVKFCRDFIVLETDWWFKRTQTTKNRMNQASNQFNLGFKVYQKNLTWFVEFEGKSHIFKGHKLILDR